MPLTSASFTICDLGDYIVRATMSGVPHGFLDVEIYAGGTLYTQSCYVLIRGFDGSTWTTSSLSRTTSTGRITGEYWETKSFEISVYSDNTLVNLLTSSTVSFNGEDSVSLILTKDSAQVIADQYGNVLSYDSAYTSLKVFKGSQEVTDAIFGEHTCEDCTIDYNDRNEVHVTSMEKDIASVTLNVTYEGNSYQKKFSIVKQKKGQSQYLCAQGNFATDSLAENWFVGNCGEVSEGCYYVNSSNYNVRIYKDVQGSLEWTTLKHSDFESAEILPLVEKQFIDLYNQPGISEENKSKIWSNFDYEETFVAKAISTSKIEMTGEGVIASEGIPLNSSQGLSNGFLTKTGYRLEGDTGTFRASNSYIDNGHFKGGEFEDISISGNSSFGGEIDSPVLKTKNDTQPGDTVTAVARIPRGVRGDQLKSHINNLLNSVTNSSGITVVQATGTLFGSGTFDNVIVVRSIPAGDETLAQYNGLESYTRSETFDWYNPFPIPIEVFAQTTPKGCSYPYTKKTYGWQLTGRETRLSHEEPTQLPKPSRAHLGDTWVEYSNVREFVTGRYVYEEITYTYSLISESQISRNEDGEIRYYTSSPYEYESYNGEKIIVPANGRFGIVLAGADEHQDATSTYSGSVAFKWTPSNNFEVGKLFVSSSNRLFYLSSRSDDVWASSQTVEFRLNSETVGSLNLVVGNTSAWNYNSSFGVIDKMYVFEWTSAPSESPTYSGLYTQFSEYRVSLQYPNGQQFYITPLKTVSYTQNSIQLIGQSSSANLTPTTYLKNYDISITPVTVSSGVFSHSIVPIDKTDPSERRELGSPTKYWDAIYVTDAYITNTHSQGGSAVYTPKGTVSRPSLDVTETKKNIQLTTALRQGDDGEYSCLEISAIAIDVTDPSAGTAAQVLSGVDVTVSSDPIFTGTQETIIVN